jgi:hypothetical protein
MVGFRLLFALFAEINKVIKIHFAENKILLFFFSRVDFEKNSDKKVRRSEGKLADRVKKKKENQSGDT